MGAVTPPGGVTSSSRPPADARVAGRYRIRGDLGTGGMARVHAVWDEVSGREMALKQMLPEYVESKPAHIELFKREYQTAMQMAHPRIVEVYDYGVDKGVPYYTMELLQGSDLHHLAPVPWVQACELLRDVASALAMIHSRRLLHRDVTPRNVRCTPDGRAKLIDFGGMTAMGIAKHVVGTPPFIAPEALRALAMDGRTDLYSLGALGYWLVAARHAYPARSLPDLEMRWRKPPPSLSTWVPDCPPSLDALIHALLSLDMMERPGSAAEVIERLNAIAELPADEHAQVAQAYLTMPMLVGRDALLKRFRTQVHHASQGHGVAVSLEGEPGMGRSRVLSSCALEGQFMGASVARASAREAGELGVLRALVDELLDHLPEPVRGTAGPPGEPLARLRGEATHGLSSLRVHGREATSRSEELSAGDAGSVVKAFIAWIRKVTLEHPVVLAVDDVALADESTVAALAALARSARKHKLVLAVSLEPSTRHASSGALRMLCKRAVELRLTPLSLEETGELLRSIFGTMVQTGNVTRWVHTHSRGNPRMALDLARHLVDREVVRYEGGTWVLPPTLEGLGLPESLAQVLDARVETLGTDARRLGGALALASHHELPSVSEYGALLAAGDDSEARVARALDELLASEILVDARYGHAFAQSGFVDALIHATSDEHVAIHRALAKVFSAREDSRLVAVHHMQRAGDDEAALGSVLEHIHEGEPEAERAKLPSGLRIEAFRRAEAQCVALGRPPVQRLLVQRSLVRLAGGYDASLSVYADAAIERLRLDSGLQHWSELSDIVDPVERIKQCVGKAQAAYEATPEAERGMDPITAIRTLAFIGMHMTAVHSRALDVEGLHRIDALLEPLSHVSSTVHALWMVVRGAICKDTGRPTDRWYAAALQKLGTSSGGVMDGQRNVRGITTFSLACDAVSEEPMRALALAEDLERDSLFGALASEVRVLVALHAGDMEAAARHREDRDGRASGVRAQLTRALLLEAHAYAACRDLMELKALLEPIGEQAQRFEGWRPVLHWVRGEYRRLRGQPERAKEELEKSLALVRPGEHIAWVYATMTYLKVLLELRETKLAHALAQEAVEHAERLELLAPFKTELSSVLALAEATQRDFDKAKARVSRNIDMLLEQGGGVLSLGRQYEVLARIAMMARDREGFEAAVREAESLYVTTSAPGLLSRARKLWRQGMQRFEGKQALRTQSSSLEPGAATTQTVLSQLRPCSTRQARIQRILELLLEYLDAHEGYLFPANGNRVDPAVAVGLPPSPPQLQERMQGYIDQQLSDATVTDEVSESVGQSGSVSLWRGPEETGLRVIPMHSRTSKGTVLTGVALVTQFADRSQLVEMTATLSDALLSSGDVEGIALED